MTDKRVIFDATSLVAYGLEGSVLPLRTRAEVVCLQVAIFVSVVRRGLGLVVVRTTIGFDVAF